MQVQLSRFGQFGAALTSEQSMVASGIMDQVVQNLRTAVSILKARVAAEQRLEKLSLLAGPLGLLTSLFTSTDEAKKAVLSGLRTIEESINMANGPRRAEVLAGTVTIDGWLRAAETRAQGIRDQAKILSDEATINLVTETMANAWEEAKKYLPTPGQVKWGLIAGVAAAAFAAVFILPRVLGFTPVGRAFRGYSKGTKARRKTRKSKRLSLWEPEDELD